MRKSTFVSILLVLTAFLQAGGCGKKSEISIPDPVIYSVSPDSAAYGDTVVMEGAGFGDERSLMRASFSPLPASGVFPSGEKAAGGGECCRTVVPISASKNRMVAVVPDGAFTGSVRVERDAIGPSFPFGVDVPLSKSGALPFSVYLDVGDVGRVFFSGPYYEFTRKALDSEDGYLLILFDSSVPSSGSSEYGYSLSISRDSHSPKAEDAMAVERPRRRSEARYTLSMASMLGESKLKRKVRDEIGRLLRHSERTFRNGFSPKARRPVHPEGEEGTMERTLLAPQTTHFKVFNNVDGSVLDPDNFSDVEAELMYTGDHTLLYVDVTTPSSYFTQSDAELLGGIFDDHIYQTDHQYFGSESDINGDGKVVILLSPVINRLTAPGAASTEGFIAGFFLANDLMPGMLDGRVTNGMEIFYCIVPDPDGTYGNVFPKLETIDILKGILAHEFLHMILFNYRVLIYGKGYLGDYMEELWINEGLAHIAEDLNGFNQSNVKRANLFLQDPGDVTLIYGGDELEERGASYLFLRYLGDRFGNTIFRSLVQTHDVGVENIENRTGESFFDIFTDWAAACYLSGTGISDDTRFEFTSIDLRNDFDPLYVVDLPSDASSFNSNVRAMAPEFVRLHIDTGFIYTIEVQSSLLSGGGRMNFAIIRLD